MDELVDIDGLLRHPESFQYDEAQPNGNLKLYYASEKLLPLTSVDIAEDTFDRAHPLLQDFISHKNMKRCFGFVDLHKSVKAD
ncbi:CLUMA_CG016072, isoform A [Clunio marinus]|uniref:CLUMA_CG016072, isoform A n=1 Tax=Clunio marinus TaxID=568069 RepID=A0A1J1IR84_9DIPT|nr:CLUMA_CG016072, isoform A [Clunio marinus]